MRISKTFGERTEIQRKAIKKYYLIYEGSKTEMQYFNGISQNKDYLDIDSLIEIVPILRSYNEEDWSNPKKILDKLIEYINEKNTDSLSADTFTDKVIDWLLDEQIIGECGIYNKYNIKYELIKLFDSSASKVNLNECLEKVSDFLTQNLNISDSIVQIKEYVKNQFVTYERGYDKICLIADRDKQSFKKEQYEYVVSTCAENDYNLYISNPCFEFWLLLHFDEILDIDKKLLLENKKESARKRFLEKQLSDLMGGYSKNNIKFDMLVNRVENAIENEKNFCEDIDELKENLGCNIGLLIKEMQCHQ